MSTEKGSLHGGSSYFDVVIVGAGISGIDAAYRVQTELPERNYTILEGRGSIGGTWDLFRYPGVRSDSDLFTYGFPWRPWTERRGIAEGASILNYLKESTAIEGIDRHIQFHHSLIAANWSTEKQMWTLKVNAKDEITYLHARFLIMGSGYYDYKQPLPASILGLNDFNGKVVHPQFWPQDLDYADKKVIIIGSGATAVTLLPSLAEKAANVTMLQRSPSYILGVPNPAAGSFIQRYLPESLASKLTLLKFLILHVVFYYFCRLFPDTARRIFRDNAAKQLPKDYPLDPNFKPSYRPWDQRLCVAPDGDFFTALCQGKAEVVTGTIRKVTESSILLESGQKLDADIIITATGLKLSFGGGAKLSVDHEPVIYRDKFIWKGTLLQDVPNCLFVVGYSNATFTIAADTSAYLFCRILKTMTQRGFTSVVPRVRDPKSMKALPVLNLKSTYAVRGQNELPKAGDVGPWKRRNNYFVDFYLSRFGDINDGLEYSRGPSPTLKNIS